MRALGLCLLFAATTPTHATTVGEATRAAADDQLLANAGIEPEAAKLRVPCNFAKLETDDPPEVRAGVCVLTEHDFFIFSLETGQLISEVQLKLRFLDGVGLKKFGRNRQVHLFKEDRIYMVYVPGLIFVDTKRTEALYQQLLVYGVPSHAAGKFISEY